jgi:hypothetical protein
MPFDGTATHSSFGVMTPPRLKLALRQIERLFKNFVIGFATIARPRELAKILEDGSNNNNPST